MSKLNDLNRIAVELEKLVVLQAATLKNQAPDIFKTVESFMRKNIKEHNITVEQTNE